MSDALPSEVSKKRLIIMIFVIALVRGERDGCFGHAHESCHRKMSIKDPEDTETDSTVYTIQWTTTRGKL